MVGVGGRTWLKEVAGGKRGGACPSLRLRRPAMSGSARAPPATTSHSATASRPRPTFSLVPGVHLNLPREHCNLDISFLSNFHAVPFPKLSTLFFQSRPAAHRSRIGLRLWQSPRPPLPTGKQNHTESTNSVPQQKTGRRTKFTRTTEPSTPFLVAYLRGWTMTRPSTSKGGMWKSSEG